MGLIFFTILLVRNRILNPVASTFGGVLAY